MILLTFLGPENLGRRFGVAHDHDLEDAAGHEAFATVIHRREAIGNDHESSDDGEKGAGVSTERV